MNKQELRDLVDKTDARKLTRIIEKGEKFDTEVDQLRAQNRDLKSRDGREKFKIKFYSIFTAVILLVILLGSLVGCPRYNVYRAEMNGKAAMAEAEENRKIQIEEAKANLESQKLNAKAEVERARGMAEAIEIENGKLTETYIKYLWVRNIDAMDGEKIYIPTEAGLPILEANK